MKNVHLDLASSYSLLQSTIRIDNLISYAKEKNIKTLALADINVMYGSYEFYQKCKKNNIKAIVGLHIVFENIDIIVYAKNETGYKNLLKISSLIKEDKASVDKIKSLLKDVITIGDNCDYSHNDVITNQVRYIKEEGFKALEVVKAISSASKLNIAEIKDNKLFFKDDSAFNDTQSANIAKIINDCNLEFAEHGFILPKYDCPKDLSSKDYLRHLCTQGLKYRLNNEITKDYMDRLEEELQVINSMGYDDYFLIVWDFVRFAKKSGIRVGPGRGSAAGSLVSYCLTITDVDPIQYNLLFERFLNKDRVSMPDIDIDFMDTRREEVIDYIAEKYGKDNVALIITFQTIAARSSIRDVARVIGVDLKDADAISKAIPSAPGTTLDFAYKKQKKFRTIIDSSELFTELFNMAKEIEGVPRNFSTHAAGIVVADKSINNYVPTQTGSTELILSQYSMKYLEEIGLLKIDILGLRNLTIINEILSLIQKRHDKYIKLADIDFNDAKTIAPLKKGLTTGIFQLESAGMKSTLKRMQASSLEDIVSTSSLFRPGPQENIPSFINRKHGREQVTYIDESIKDILEPTYGIIVYQEQIMQIATAYAGFSLSQADILRRAMGKKIASELTAMQQSFIDGAIVKGHTEAQAKKVFELIFKFADYGFNRSHAVAYSVIGFQMLYLKANYTLEFMSCLLSSVVGSADKISNYLDECKQFDIQILKPSINSSTSQFRISKDKIIYPLTALKQLGSAVYKELARVRMDGRFEDVYDFFGRISTARVSSSSVTSMIKSGALDEFGHNRSTLLASMEILNKWAKSCCIKKDGETIFDKTLLPQPALVETEETEKEVKKFELESIGFVFSVEEKQIAQGAGTPIETLSTLENKATVTISGTVRYVRPFTTKWGQTMAFSNIKDSTGTVDLMLSPTIYSTYQAELKQGVTATVTGELVNGNKLQVKPKTITIT